MDKTVYFMTLLIMGCIANIVYFKSPVYLLDLFTRFGRFDIKTNKPPKIKPISNEATATKVQMIKSD